VTISLGVAAGNPSLTDRRDRLLIEADVALYEAKHQGRNSVVLALNDCVATT
jgi:PleD family two-component response regulator